MKALSIRGAWAHMIIHAPWHKNIENRSRNMRYRGPLLIHCGKDWTGAEQDECKWFCEEQGLPKPPPLSELQIGGIIGQVEVIDCVTSSDSPWFVGKCGIVLANPQPLEFIPYKGRLGLFEVDLDALRVEQAEPSI